MTDTKPEVVNTHRVPGLAEAAAAVAAELARVAAIADPGRRQAAAAEITVAIRDTMNDLLGRSTAIRANAVREIYTEVKGNRKRGSWIEVGQRIGTSGPVAFRLGTYGHSGGQRSTSSKTTG
jgi:hypothetical protein